MVFALLACSAPLPPGEAWVAVPDRDLPVGTVVSARDLRSVHLPEEFVLRTAIVDPNRVVGRTTTSRILEGELVRSERLGPAVPGVVPDPSFGAPAADGDWNLRGVEIVTAVVAARDLPAWTPVNPSDLYLVMIPRRNLPAEVLLDRERVAGATPCEPLLADEFVRAERLVDPATGACGR